jgi:hypothetical protein
MMRLLCVQIREKRLESLLVSLSDEMGRAVKRSGR